MGNVLTLVKLRIDTTTLSKHYGQHSSSKYVAAVRDGRFWYGPNPMTLTPDEAANLVEQHRGEFGEFKRVGHRPAGRSTLVIEPGQ